jgi:8-oxo-dGTP diphosphatase
VSDSAGAHAPILAAGGIVLRQGSRLRFAIVRLRREKSWVLPKGKLYPGEHALAGAKREVMEETGYDVLIHGFLGTMLYSEAAGRIKIVQFWHMRAIGGPKRELMPDVKTVKWLPLKQAIETLTRVHEKVFLANVGPMRWRPRSNPCVASPRPLVTITAIDGSIAEPLRQAPLVCGMNGSCAPLAYGPNLIRTLPGMRPRAIRHRAIYRSNENGMPSVHPRVQRAYSRDAARASTSP